MQTLTDQFKTLANAILEKQSKRFTEQNQINLGASPDLLKVGIIKFTAKADDTASAPDALRDFDPARYQRVGLHCARGQLNIHPQFYGMGCDRTSMLAPPRALISVW
jgi:hypothetical protein